MHLLAVHAFLHSVWEQFFLLKATNKIIYSK